jgi:ovo
LHDKPKITTPQLAQESSSSSGSSRTILKPSPARRFISSILGGDVPYGARGHILTQAQRKEYPHAHDEGSSSGSNIDKTEPNRKNVTIIDETLQVPQSPKKLAINKTESQPPSKDKRPTPPPPPSSSETVVRCSVIQRTPAALSAAATCSTASCNNDEADGDDNRNKLDEEDVDIKLPVSMLINQHPEPEQEQPIDYHIPKRKDSCRVDDEDDKGKKQREARRSSAILPSRALLLRNLPRSALGKINGILAAAAGHGRSSNQNSQNSGNGSSGNSINFNGSSGVGGGGNSANNSGGSGAMGGGGSGAGGGMGGRDGRSNYGPNSPPTGSLPPFYESLKGGNNGMNSYNANGSYMTSNGYNMMNSGLNMDCDSTQELANLGAYSDGTMTSKQYSMLQNAYGIALKDEQDLDYETKVDPLTLNSNLLHGGYGAYDDSMMVDIAGVGVVDPLQFTATLTFSSPADHALLDSLSDAVDLSQFLQRLPNDDHDSPQNDLELSNTPSLSPDSVSVTPVEAASCLEPFPEHLILGGRGYDSQRNSYNNYGSSNNNKYHDNPPSYQTAARDIHHMMTQQQHNIHHQQQHHHHHHHQQDHMLSGGSSSNHHQFDLDSHSNLSLPSPASVHSSHMDGSGHSDMYDGSPGTPAPTPQTIQNTIQNVSSHLNEFLDHKKMAAKKNLNVFLL